MKSIKKNRSIKIYVEEGRERRMLDEKEERWK